MFIKFKPVYKIKAGCTRLIEYIATEGCRHMVRTNKNGWRVTQLNCVSQINWRARRWNVLACPLPPLLYNDDQCGQCGGLVPVPGLNARYAESYVTFEPTANCCVLRAGPQLINLVPQQASGWRVLFFPLSRPLICQRTAKSINIMVIFLYNEARGA